MTSQNEENLLSRWSRRKQQAIAETEKEEGLVELKYQPEFDGAIQKEGNEQDEQTQPILTDEDMPPIESLTEESDYSGFMSKGVSDELRNLALGKLFRAPSFNIRDGLDEYDEDFTSFEKLGDIVTCDMKHQLEMEAKKKLEDEARNNTEDDAESAQLQEEDVEDDILIPSEEEGLQASNDGVADLTSDADTEQAPQNMEKKNVRDK